LLVDEPPIAAAALKVLLALVGVIERKFDVGEAARFWTEPELFEPFSGWVRRVSIQVPAVSDQ